jgi:hypothetical protein
MRLCALLGIHRLTNERSAPFNHCSSAPYCPTIRKQRLPKENRMPTNHETQPTLAWVLPVVIALVFITAASLLKEPGRRQFMAVMIAGAGATYLSGGFGLWEFAFNALTTFIAYKGLKSYRMIGAGWLLHTAWDVLHHLHGHPIIPFVASSSFGCAICDPVIAAWCFAGAPSLLQFFARNNRRVA